MNTIASPLSSTPCPNHAPPLSQQKDIQWQDCGPLGIVGSLNGTLLKQLADQGAFGGGFGLARWDERLRVQLAAGWEEFQDWAKASKLTKNLVCFTPGKLSVSRLSDYACRSLFERHVDHENIQSEP